MTTPMFPVPAGAHQTGATDTKWFAGLAMQAILSQQSIVPDSEAQREEIALWSWRLAQAMVATEKRIHADQD